MARPMKEGSVAYPVVTGSGRVLTEGDVDRLADEAEQGFDLSTWTPRPGRPALDAGATEPSPRIAVRVPKLLHRKVASRATSEGRTVSQVVRTLLEDYVRSPALGATTPQPPRRPVIPLADLLADLEGDRADR